MNLINIIKHKYNLVIIDWYQFFYLALVFVLVVFPGAKPFGIQIKLYLTVFLCFSYILFWNKKYIYKYRWISYKSHLYYSINMLLILIVWSLIGYFNLFDPMPELRAMLAPILVLFFFHPSRIKISELRVFLIVSICVYSILKIIAYYGIYFGIFSYNFLHHVIHDLLGSEIVGALSCKKNSFQMIFANDLLVAFSPILFIRKINKIDKSIILMTIITFLVILISSSRFLIFSYLISILIALYLNFELKNIIKIFIILFLTLFLCPNSECILNRILPFNLNNIFYIFFQYEGVDIVSEFNPSNDFSDNIRADQIIPLLNQFKDNIIFGSGIGSYILNYVRLPKFPFSYELYFLSLLYKFGLLGMLLCASILYGYFRKIVDDQFRFVLLILALLSGFFNPYYTNGIFGLVLISILMLGVDEEP